MSTNAELLEQANAAAPTKPREAEALYKQILSAPGASEGDARDGTMREQETALVKLGELYRDQKCVKMRSFCCYQCADVLQERGRRCGSDHAFPLIHVFDRKSKDRQAECVSIIFYCHTKCSCSTVRTLLDFFTAIPDSQDTQIGVLNDNIAWAQREKRIFLKQSLETRLIALYVLSHPFYSHFFAFFLHTPCHIVSPFTTFRKAGVVDDAYY
jgi:26S proteasome regulatory subunit N6